MPRGDRTGPVGIGPMTGRGFGYCTGYPRPGYAQAGYGFGRGRGFRRMVAMGTMPAPAHYGAATYDYPYPMQTNVDPPFDEKQALKNQISMLENQLEQLKTRQAELEKDV